MPDEITVNCTASLLPLPRRTPDTVETVIRPSALEFCLSDGTIITYPREPINIGALTFSYREVEAGQYLYEYILDNRQVEMIRIGDFDDHFDDCFGRPKVSGPDGWVGHSTGWFTSPSETPIRSEAAKYSIVSSYLPGPLPLHIQGPQKVQEDLELPLKGATRAERYVMQVIWHDICSYSNCVRPLVIGPAFKPQPSEQEVRDRIRQCVQEYYDDLRFLRPFDEDSCNLMATEKNVPPATDFKAQVLDCLNVAIRAMIGDGTVRS